MAVFNILVINELYYEYASFMPSLRTIHFLL